MQNQGDLDGPPCIYIYIIYDFFTFIFFDDLLSWVCCTCFMIKSEVLRTIPGSFYLVDLHNSASKMRRKKTLKKCKFSEIDHFEMIEVFFV